MDDLPRHKLRDLIVTHGPSLCKDPRRCEALLRDTCGSYKREIHVLVNALKSQLAEDLLGSRTGTPAELLYARLTTRLQDEQGLAENVALWAVDSWAFALGVITSLPSDTSVAPRSHATESGESDSLARIEWEQVRESTNIDELVTFERHFGFTPFGPLANSRRDDLAFAAAERTDSLSDFARYLQQFPNGKHAAMARERGSELSFVAAEKADTPQAYEDHLKNWPGGSFEGKAREWLAQHALRLERLDRAISQDLAQDNNASIGPAVQQFLRSLPSDGLRQRWLQLATPRIEAAREPYAFERAQKQGTALSFVTYLRQFPTGAHASEAMRALGGKCLMRTLPHNDYVHGLAFSPDTQLILSGHWGGNENAKTRLWDVASGAMVRSFGRDGYSFAFSRDGRFALSGGWKDITLWDLGSWDVIRTFPAHESAVYALALSPDGSFVLSGSGDRTLKLWKVKQRTSIFGSKNDGPIRTFEGHVDDVTSVVFSPDGRFALSGSADATLKLWDVTKGREIRTFKGHSDEIVKYESSDGTTGKYYRGKVTSVAISPDGYLALSASWDRTAKLWDVSSGRQIHTLEGTSSVLSVSFSSDGRFALTASGDSIALWEVSSGRQVYALKDPHTSADHAAFSSDGRFAVLVHGTGPIKLWNLIIV
jgi:WD40 repeat protein